MSFNPVFTDAGRQAATIDNGKGLQTRIAEIALGGAQYAIRDDAGIPTAVALEATALQNEQLRLPVLAGGDPIPGQINIIAEVPAATAGAPQFFIGEIGFYDDDGVLIAIWSDDTHSMGYRGDLVSWYLNLVLSWVDLPADQFTVQVMDGPLSEHVLLANQLTAQIRKAVEADGVAFDLRKPQQLADAIGNSDDGGSGNSGDLTDQVLAILKYMPDISAASFPLGSVYSIGEVATVTPSGATTPSGAPVFWKLTDLVGITASSTEVADGDSVDLTITGSGSLVATATCNGIQAEPIKKYFSAYAAVITPPAVVSPAANTSQLSRKPVITGAAYTTSPANHDTHIASRCQALDGSGNILWNSGEVSATTQFAVNQNLPGETDVYFRIQYKGDVLGWAEWGPSTKYTTQTAGGLGVVYPDGGIGGPVFNGQRLIVAPGSARGRSIRFGLWGTDTTLLNVTQSWDPDPRSGIENTNILIDNYSHINDGKGSIGPVAALFCRALGSDWHLPTKDELSAIFSAVSVIDAADTTGGLSLSELAGLSGVAGYAWSSTEYSSSSSCVTRASDSYIGNLVRYSECAVIPVRSEPV